MTTNHTPTPLMGPATRLEQANWDLSEALSKTRAERDELVAALREAVQMIDSHSRGITKNNPVAATMRAALAKVTP